MTALLPEIEASLMRAVARRRRVRRRLGRRTVIPAAAFLVLAGSAAAAVQPWQPLLGGPDRGVATGVDAPPPAAQLALLGVLRRPQSDADRSPAVLAGLRGLVGSADHGVHVDEVRRLGDGPDGSAIVLIPEQRQGDDVAGPRAADVTDALCVSYPAPKGARRATVRAIDGPAAAPLPVTSPGGATAFACFTDHEVATGHAVAAAPGAGGTHVWGLVPDGVAGVSVAGRRAAVHDDFFDVPAAPAAVDDVRWYDADGRDITP